MTSCDKEGPESVRLGRWHTAQPVAPLTLPPSPDVAADAAEALGHESLPDALAWALVRRAVQRCGVAPWSGCALGHCSVAVNRSST